MAAKKPQLFILLFLVSFASVGAVLFSPGLPGLASYYGISVTEAQLPVSIFLLGYALGQLPWGPIANRIGRKNTLAIGISLQIVSSFGASLMGYFCWYFPFLWFVFFTALGSGVGLKMSFTLIGDSFSRKEATKYASYTGLSFAVAPGLSVALGGLLVKWFHWQSCFIFLSVYGVFLLFLSRLLPETGGERDKNALKLKNIISTYSAEFRNKILVLSGLTWGCVTTIIYLFAQFAPFLALNHLGLDSEEYGFLSMIPSVGFVLGSVMARILASAATPFQTMSLGVIFVFLGVFIQLFCFLAGYVNFWSLFFPMPVIYLGTPLIFSNASSFALACTKNKSIASAILNFLNVGTAVFVTMLLAFLPFKKAVVLPLFFSVLLIFVIILISSLKKIVPDNS